MSCIGGEAANLKGSAKAVHFAAAFPNGFVYAGDSPADLAVWQRSEGLIVVAASPSVARVAQAFGKPIEVWFPRALPLGLDWIKAIRVDVLS